jgi:hypothetical protein
MNTLYSQNKNEYLVAYGQTWGFLKYFHPHPSSVNWDDNLLKDYNKLRNCSTDTAFNEIIAQLISQCGDYKKHERQLVDSLVFTQNFQWMNGNLFSKKNRADLKELRNNKPKFKNKYVQLNRSALNPTIKNEVNYPDSLFTNAICYLGITRYWNVINYYFPYRQLIKQNWDSVYLKLVPEFISLTDMDDYYLAVRRLNAKISDGHAFTKSKKDIFHNYNYPAIWFQSFIDGTFVSSIGENCETQFKKSDRVITIDNMSVADRYKEISDIYPASNGYYQKRHPHKLLYTLKDSISITVKRGDSLISDKLEAYPMKKYTSKKKSKKSTLTKRKASYYILPRDSSLTTGYIHMGRLEGKDLDKQFKKTILNTKNLIIDCRFYPKIDYKSFSNILLKERRYFCIWASIDFDYPGSIIKETNKTGKKNKNYYKGNIYLLVDNTSMSYSEFTIMALQTADNVITIGGQTAGADGNISKVPMPFGLNSYFSGCGVYYPNGDATQQIGIRRDHKIVQDSSYLNGNDKILNYALELIRKSKN